MVVRRGCPLLILLPWMATLSSAFVTHPQRVEGLAETSTTAPTTLSPTTATTATAAFDVEEYLRLAKRKLWTKADFFHLHAVSGVLFMVLGTLVVFGWIGDEVFGSGAAGQSAVVGWPALAIMVTGVANCITCLPMSKFTRDGQDDTKAAGFKGLGIGMTMLGIWSSYFFSGYYPEFMAPVDPVLALGFLAVIIHGIYNSEVALTRELGEVRALRQRYADSLQQGSPEAAILANSPALQETDMEIVINHRVASYPNLLHLPVLYNLIFGGQAWIHEVASRFPLEPTLLFHASFGIAVANSIVFLGATLKDRKLMTLRQWLLLQVVVLTPFVTTVVDCLVLGKDVSINPMEVYAGLMNLSS